MARSGKVWTKFQNRIDKSVTTIMINRANMKVGTQVQDVGPYPVFFETSMTRDEAFALMQEQGKVYVLASLEWTADPGQNVTGQVKVRLDPGNGIAWRYSLEPTSENY